MIKGMILCHEIKLINEMLHYNMADLHTAQLHIWGGLKLLAGGIGRSLYIIIISNICSLVDYGFASLVKVLQDGGFDTAKIARVATVIGNFHPWMAPEVSPQRFCRHTPREKSCVRLSSRS